MITGIVACSCGFFTVHDKLAAVTSVSLDKSSGMYADRRNRIFICICLARPRLQEAGCSNESKLSILPIKIDETGYSQ